MSVPALAIQACLDSIGADIGNIDHLAGGRDKDGRIGHRFTPRIKRTERSQRERAFRSLRHLIQR